MHLGSQDSRFAAFAYDHRWILSALSMALVLLLAGTGFGRVADFGGRVSSLGDTGNGAAGAPPLVFDPRMDVWFGAEDEAVLAYREIEDRFVAEDYVVVSFQADDGPFGVFERESLATIARLTEGFLQVPGVRHVRSLTSSPWIRYGGIPGTQEQGLLISDLVEVDPLELTDDDIVERMIAILGAERVAERLGESRVRDVLGVDAELGEYGGESLLLGTILDELGTTTAIQVQVLRPRVDEDVLAATFDERPEEGDVARSLYSIQAQRAALRGIEHVLRVEQGLAVPTPERAELAARIAAMPPGEERRALELELADPNRNFMRTENGELVRKFFEYEPTGEGYVDASDPNNPVTAPADFRPEPLSDFEFHVGGVPLFELNFEEVGMSDSKYMGLMFVMITLLLAVVFRSVVGVAATMAVVFGSVLGMVGGYFATGNLFNNMTIIGPNMLTAVALADTVHLVSSYAILRRRIANKRDLIVEVVQRNALPVFLTSITTAVGFYSLTISEMVPVRMFGAMCGFGAILAWLLSMTIVPMLLSLAPHHGPARAGSKGRSYLSGWEDGLTRWVLGNRAPILAGAAVLLVLGGIGLARLRIDSDFRAMFPDDNPVMSDFTWTESRLGGLGDFEIVFDGMRAEGEAFGSVEEQRLAELRLREIGAEQGYPEFEALGDADRAELARLEAREQAYLDTRIAVSGTFLGELDRFEQRLRQEMADPASPMSVLTDFVSPLDILRRMHRVQNEDRASHYRVPGELDVPDELRAERLEYDEWTDEWLHLPGQDASTLAAQYYLQYENGARPGENLATQVSMDRTRFRMQGRVMQAESERIVGAGERVREIAREEFPLLGARLVAASEDGPALEVSGKMLLFARTNRIFTVGFVQSMSIALTVITILIGTMFRSWRIAVVSLVPNVLPIVLPLSVFGLLGKPLDAPAIFVASVALGVCVDDTIHFFTKFLRSRRRGASLEDSVRYTFENTGLAITVTTIVLAFGFGTLMLSDFSPNFMMGTLASVMIALAWVCDLIVTPAVLSLVYPRAVGGDRPALQHPATQPVLQQA